MPHIHRNAGEHDATSSAYIVLTQADSEHRIFLHRHKKLNAWLQFGGHVELHETPWQAIAHELLEESGYSLNDLKLLQPPVRMSWVTGAVLHPSPVNENTHVIDTGDGTPQPHYHTDRAYAFVAAASPGAEPLEGESKELRPFTYAEIASIPEGEIPESTREIAMFILSQVVDSYDRVDPTIYAV